MAWNAQGQLTTKTYQDANTQLRLDFGYDTAGNLTSVLRYSEVAGTTLVGSSQYTYSGNQVTSIVHKDASGTVIVDFASQGIQARFVPGGGLNGIIVRGAAPTHCIRYGNTGPTKALTSR